MRIELTTQLPHRPGGLTLRTFYVVSPWAAVTKCHRRSGHGHTAGKQLQKNSGRSYSKFLVQLTVTAQNPPVMSLHNSPLPGLPLEGGKERVHVLRNQQDEPRRWKICGEEGGGAGPQPGLFPVRPPGSAPGPPLAAVLDGGRGSHSAPVALETVGAAAAAAEWVDLAREPDRSATCEPTAVYPHLKAVKGRSRHWLASSLGP